MTTLSNRPWTPHPQGRVLPRMPCSQCGDKAHVHVDGKCPFGPMTYQPIIPQDYRTYYHLVQVCKPDHGSRMEAMFFDDQDIWCCEQERGQIAIWTYIGQGSWTPGT